MSKYKEECKKFLDDLPKMDKKFQERTLKRYKSLTSIILLNFGNNIEEYLEYKKDKASIDYYDICKALNLEPEDIRIDYMKKHYDRLAGLKHDEND